PPQSRRTLPVLRVHVVVVIANTSTRTRSPYFMRPARFQARPYDVDASPGRAKPTLSRPRPSEDVRARALGSRIRSRGGRRRPPVGPGLFDCRAPRTCSPRVGPRHRPALRAVRANAQPRKIDACAGQGPPNGFRTGIETRARQCDIIGVTRGPAPLE